MEPIRHYLKSNLRKRRSSFLNFNKKSLNFEKYAAEGNRFIYDVAEELKVDRNQAARIVRAVLHALRDRLPPHDAIEFAQALPMALKGVFIDRYDISITPVIIRRADEFLDYIRSKAPLTADTDFVNARFTERALRGVFKVLENHMDYKQIDHIQNFLGHEINDMINRDNKRKFEGLRAWDW